MNKAPRKTRPLFERLESELAQYTAAERAIANFMLTNKNALPFETAASIAQRIGISAVTVGRFCRMLGYRHYRDLKADLKTRITDSPWLQGDELSAFISRAQDKDQTKRTLELELASIVDVHRLAETPAWEAAVALLARTQRVHVAGFQTERGMAALLVHLLQYLREDVHLVDVAAGNYSEIFLGPIKKSCLVIFDTRRYSRQSYLLAEKAKEHGLALIIITDTFCDWGRKFTPYVFMVSTESGLFWGSSVALCSLIDMLTTAIASKLGARAVEKRLSQVYELHQHFTGYVGLPNRERRS